LSRGQGEAKGEQTKKLPRERRGTKGRHIDETNLQDWLGARNCQRNETGARDDALRTSNRRRRIPRGTEMRDQDDKTGLEGTTRCTPNTAEEEIPDKTIEQTSWRPRYSDVIDGSLPEAKRMREWGAEELGRGFWSRGIVACSDDGAGACPDGTRSDVIDGSPQEAERGWRDIRECWKHEDRRCGASCTMGAFAGDGRRVRGV
jgi:hypothetical protein